MRARLLATTMIALGVSGCGKDAPDPALGPAPEPEAQAPSGPVLLCIGDSLTAGYGVLESEAWTQRLAEALEARGSEWTVRNAGVSGDTSAGVVRRLDWLLTEDVDVVFLAIGANDGLRGTPLSETKRNLEAIALAVKKAGKRLVLAGQKIPANYGPEYTEGFEALYRDLAEAQGVPLMPFLLEGVGGVAAMNLPDGIHPNAKGHAHIAERVLAFLDEEGIWGG